jgi:hypothetical protein
MGCALAVFITVPAQRFPESLVAAGQGNERTTGKQLLYELHRPGAKALAPVAASDLDEVDMNRVLQIRRDVIASMGPAGSTRSMRATSSPARRKL